MFYYHHQEVCLFCNVFRYCQSRVIESLFLIERLWREEVCREKENLSEMFLVFKQLLRRRGGWPTLLKVAWQAPFIYPPPLHRPFSCPIWKKGFLKAEHQLVWSKRGKMVGKHFADFPRLLRCIMCIFCLKCKFQQENSLFIESEKCLQFLVKAVYPWHVPPLIKYDAWVRHDLCRI